MLLKGTFLSVRKPPGMKDPGSFRLKRFGDGQTIICLGCGWNLKKRTPLILDGEWINEATGIFEVRQINFWSEEETVCIKFFEKGHFEKIGEKNAVKLFQVLSETARTENTTFDTFSSERLFQILETLNMSGSKFQLAAAIHGIYARNQLSKQMQKYGITPKDVENLYIAYGENAWQELNHSPYQGIALGISFHVCDKVAWELIPDATPWNKDRISAALKELTNKIAGTGSCCIRIKSAIQFLEHLLRQHPSGRLSQAFIYTMLISSSEFIIRNTESYGVVIYPKYYFYVERDIVTEINRLNNSSEALGFSGYRGSSHLDEDQIYAMDFLKSTGIKILYGGPGAGKTTTIHEFIEEFQRLCPDQSVILAAPTGRAAARISESCNGQYNALTIHKLLGVTPYESHLKCKQDADNPLPKGLIILDEMSMADELLFLRFLQAIPNGSLVILTGDPDQLPSVASGTVLRDLINSKMLESKRLNGNHRQNGGSIVENYKKLLHKDVHLICDANFEIVSVQSEQEAVAMVKQLYTDYYSDKPDDFQILTAVKKGDLGRDIINQHISEWRAEDDTIEMQGVIGYRNIIENGHTHCQIVRKGIYSIGDRIIMTRNNYEKGYWNGDVGIIESIEETGEFKIRFYNGIRIIDNESSMDMEHAFAITVHKSQGSEYRHVVLILDPQYPGMLYRSLFLTAITRAKERVTIITAEDAVHKSIVTDKEASRITGLCEMLKLS